MEPCLSSQEAAHLPLGDDVGQVMAEAAEQATLASVAQEVEAHPALLAINSHDLLHVM